VQRGWVRERVTVDCKDVGVVSGVTITELRQPYDVLIIEATYSLS
jgi:hypothetical protein